MKPLKQTTALTAIATSAFLYVPSLHVPLAFAEGSAGSASAVASAAAPDVMGIVAPAAIAVATAAAVAGAVGIGVQSRKRRQLEQERYMSWIQGNLTGADLTGWDDLAAFPDYHDDEPDGHAIESMPHIDEIHEKNHGETIDCIDDLKSFRSSNSTVNELLSWGGVDRLSNQSFGKGMPNVNGNAAGAGSGAGAGASRAAKGASRLAQRSTPRQFRPEYTAGGTYIPRHAGKKARPASSMSNNTFISRLESQYADVLGAVGAPIANPPQQVANAAAARLDMIIPTIGHSNFGKIDAARHPVGKRPAITVQHSQMTSADKVASALANKKSLEEAAAEIAKAGKISARASAATATALRNAGMHAVVRNHPDMKARANDVVPVKRGPGFVDVNDDTFVRVGAGSAAAGMPESARLSSYQLDNSLPAANGRAVSCTDSISDFACNVISKTYFTQGDMVKVEYSQGSPKWDGDWQPGSESARRRSYDIEREKSRSLTSGIHLRPAVALASVPLV